MCLKNATGRVLGGLLVFVWFSLTAGKGSKAIRSVGKEGRCLWVLFSVWNERHCWDQVRQDLEFWGVSELCHRRVGFP